MLPLIMAGISAATSIAGGIINSREANKSAEKQQAMINKQNAENQAWYNRRYFEDGTQRADVQRVLTRAQDTLRRNNMAASGTNAVMGGTNASAAAAKEANNMAYADAVSQAAAQAESRKDGIEQTYMQNKAANEQQQMQLDAARSESKQKAVSDAVNAVGQVASAAAGSVDYGAPAAKKSSGSGAIGAPVGNGSNSIIRAKNSLDHRIRVNNLDNDIRLGSANAQSSFDSWLKKNGGKKINLN